MILCIPHRQPHRQHINQSQLQNPREHGGFDVLALFVGVEDNEGVGFFGERGFGRRHADDTRTVGLGEFGRFDKLGRFARA